MCAVATIGFTETDIMIEEGNFSMEQSLEVCVGLTLEPGQNLERQVTGIVQTVSGTATGIQDI